MDTFKKRQIELYLEKTDQVTDVWVSNGDKNVVEFDNQSNHDSYSEQSAYD